MLTEERKNEILNIVNERKSITVQELRDIMNVSESTVRRDITALGKEGKLIKVFGGAVALDDPAARTDITVLMKESINRAEKLTIARYAAALIRPREECHLCDKLRIPCAESDE